MVTRASLPKRLSAATLSLAALGGELYSITIETRNWLKQLVNELNGIQSRLATQQAAISSAAVESFYFTKPTTPHAQDDEFTSSLNPAWRLYDETADAIITFGSGNLTTYTLNSTTGMLVDCNALYPSWVLMQPKNVDTYYWFTKNYTLATNQFICARVNGSFRSSVGADDVEYGLVIAADNGGKPDKTNYYSLRRPTAVNNNFNTIKDVAGVTTSLVTGGNTPQGTSSGMHYLVIQKIGTTYHAFVVGLDGYGDYLGNTTHASTMAWVGFRMRQAAGASIQPFVRCDSIRFRDAIVTI